MIRRRADRAHPAVARRYRRGRRDRITVAFEQDSAAQPEVSSGGLVGAYCERGQRRVRLVRVDRSSGPQPDLDLGRGDFDVGPAHCACRVVYVPA